MLDANNDGEVSLEEFIAGFDKFKSIRDGGRANFNSGTVQQWGFQKWKLDRWLTFDGKEISVYKCKGRPEPNQEPKFTIPMDISVCHKDPTNACRFSIDTGFSMVHFRYALLHHKKHARRAAVMRDQATTGIGALLTLIWIAVGLTRKRHGNGGATRSRQHRSPLQSNELT